MAAAPGVQESLSAATITYLPRGGGSRSIKAIVEYVGAQSLDGLKGGSRPHVELYVRNDVAAGISSREIDTGGDKVQVPLRMGRSVRTVRIVKILAQDRAMLRLAAW